MISIFVVVVGAVIVVLIATAVALSASRKTWEVNHAGHRIALENTFGGEKLYIDGQLVDQRAGMAISSDLRGQLRNSDGSVSVVTGRIRQGTLGLTIRGYILVDDRLVGGDPL